MDLNGLNVLVDGYNLELEKGSGIKTYGLTLIEALNLLGANVYVLFSSSSSSSSNPILKEVLFFDYKKKDGHNKLGLIKNLSKAVVRGFRGKAEIISQHTKKIVIRQDSDLINSVGIMNLEGCYEISNIAYKIFNLQTKITAPKKIDVWHATYPLPIKIKKAKKITTIHDLIPLKLPYTTLDDKRFFYKIVQNAIKESALILTPSENTKNDILEIFDVREDKIFVSYQTVRIKPVESLDDIAKFLKVYGLKPKNYILFVGAIEPKKNIGRLIDAYSMVGTSMPLVIVGKKAWLWEEEITGRNLKNVHFLEYVPVENLRYLYTGAYCFMFPSLYEGFGLPPLEAMTCGCPVITSNVASLPEVCGEAALYVDPYDINDIREKIEYLVSNPQLRNKLSMAGKERAKLFSMENYVKRLYEAYQRIL
jgi:glycosyltransferase involved in cell wall biosynthesis